MDFKPVCLRVTFCNAKILVSGEVRNGVFNFVQVSVSPFKTILDLKKEVTRVYHHHYPQKALVAKRDVMTMPNHLLLITGKNVNVYKTVADI